MQRLDAATADRWLATMVPSWLHRHALPAVGVLGLVAWFDAASASWIVMVACLGAVLLQLAAPRVGWLIGVGSVPLALVLERDSFVRDIWVFIAAACLVLLVWSEISRRRQRALDIGGGGLEVRIAFDYLERVGVFTDEPQPRLVALFDVERTLKLEDALVGVDEDDDDLVEGITAAELRPFAGRAVLEGGLVEGNRPRIVTPAGSLRASGGLRARRRRETFEPLSDDALPDLPDSREAANLETRIPDLPWRPKPATDVEGVGWLPKVATVGLVIWTIVGWFSPREVGWLEFVAVSLVVLGIPIGIEQLCQRMVVDRDGVRIRGALLDRTIPWSRVRDIRRQNGGKVVVDLGDKRTRTMRFDGQDGRPSSRRVAEVLRAVRAQASVPTHVKPVRLSWGAPLVVAYVAGLAVAAYYVLTRF